MSSVWHNSWSTLQTQGSTLNNILYLWSKDPPPPKKGVHTKNDHAWFQTHKREHHDTWKVGFFFFYIQVALSWSLNFFFINLCIIDKNTDEKIHNHITVDQQIPNTNYYQS